MRNYYYLGGRLALMTRLVVPVLPPVLFALPVPILNVPTAPPMPVDCAPNIWFPANPGVGVGAAFIPNAPVVGVGADG